MSNLHLQLKTGELNGSHILAAQNREASAHRTIGGGAHDSMMQQVGDTDDLYDISGFASDASDAPQNTVEENVLLQDQEEVQKSR